MGDVSIDLRKKITIVTGPPDSGKTNLVKYLLSLPEYQRHLVYDPLFGYDDSIHNVVRPPSRSPEYRRFQSGNPELNRAVDRFVLVGEDKRPHYFVIDEAGRLLPNGKFEGSAMGELNDFNAHYGIGVILIGQRLAQINSDFENKATRYFVLGYAGKNDRRALRDVHRDAPHFVDASERFAPTYIRIDNDKVVNLEAPPQMSEKSMM